MQIKLRRIDNDFGFEASNELGAKLVLDANPSAGGNGLGLTPMQAILAAIGGCSAIDIVSILKKQKQEIINFEMTVDGAREQGAIPSPFTAIHITYHLTGQIDKEKAQRAADLSIEKYCSVSKMLEKSATITYEVQIH